MKRYLQYSLVAAILLGLGTSQVQAGNDEAIAAIGGFVAGVITGAVLDDDRHGGHHDHYYTDRHYYPRRGEYRYSSHRDRHGPSGRWEIRRVKVWVPGHWTFTYNRCGDRIRIWKSGYHIWQKNRVWVPFRDKRSHRRYRD